MQTYWILVLIGAALFGLEIFLPMGFAGLLGGFLFLMAAWHAVQQFSGILGMALGFLAVIIACGMVYLVVHVFPKCKVGRNLTLGADMKDSRADNTGLMALKGKTGVAKTLLRPAGYAEIGDQRIDVVSSGMEIPAGTPVRVTDVEGNRVIVEPVPRDDENAGESPF